jgi:serine/threonine protein kinase
MNKKQLFTKGRVAISLIVFGFLSLNLKGTPILLDVDLDSNLLAKIAQNIEELNFLETVSGFKILPEVPVIVNPNNFLGQGSCGIVFGGTHGDQEVVLKQLLEGAEEELIREYRNAQDLLEAMVEVLRKSYIKHTEIPEEVWLGMQSLVCSVGKTQNGFLFQKRVIGHNVFNTIVKGILPYYHGYPDNLRDAILRAADFFSTLAALHKLGFIFGDISSGNVVIEDGTLPYVLYEGIDWTYEPFLNHPCRMIDFAFLTRIGIFLPYYVVNQPVEKLPQEYWEAHEAFFALQNQLDETNNQLTNVVSQLEDVIATQQRYERIRSNQYWSYFYNYVLNPFTLGYVHVPTDEDMAQLDEQKQELMEQKAVLQQRKMDLLAQQESIPLPPAHPSFDIYQSVPLLEALLFGTLRIPECPNFCEDIRQVGNEMLAAIGQTYLEHIFLELLAIVEAMSHPDPSLRPSAKDIANKLYDIGTNYQTEYFR